jgi:hypothetical protein
MSTLYQRSPVNSKVAAKINSLVNRNRGIKRVHSRIWVDEEFVLWCLGIREYNYLNELGVTIRDILDPRLSRLPVINYNNYGLTVFHEHNFTPYPDLFYESQTRRFHNEYTPPGHLSTLSDIGRVESSVEEVRERVCRWVIDDVLSLYLEELFTS